MVQFSGLNWNPSDFANPGAQLDAGLQSGLANYFKQRQMQIEQNRFDSMAQFQKDRAGHMDAQDALGLQKLGEELDYKNRALAEEGRHNRAMEKAGAAKGNTDFTNATPQDWQLAKGISEYKINPNVASSRTKLPMLTAMAMTLNPSYNSLQFPRAQAAMKDFSPGGKSWQAINSANVLSQHLGEFDKSLSALNPGGIPATNYLGNLAAGAMGNPNLSAAQAAQGAIKSEFAKIFQGAGAATDEERKSIDQALSLNQNPTQWAASKGVLANLLGARMKTLVQAKEDATQHSLESPLLNKYAADAYTKMGIKPESIDPVIGRGIEAPPTDPNTKQAGGSKTGLDKYDFGF